MPVTASQQFKVKGLRERRAKIKSQIEALGTKIRKEERGLEADEQAAFDQLKTDFAAVSDSIRKAEADMQALDAALQADTGDDSTAGADGSTPPDPSADGGMNSLRPDTLKRKGGDGAALKPTHARSLAFTAWARSQHGLPLTPQMRAACKLTGLSPRAKHFDFDMAKYRKQKRSQNTGTNASGGYTLARLFEDSLEQALKDFSNVRGVVDEFTTDTGATLDYPTEDDTGNTGVRISEEQEVSFADDTFSTVTFYTYKYTSKGVLISYELLNDSEFDLESILGQQIGTRIGRIQGTEFTTGTGSSQPQGIVTAATAGLTTASATAFTADELTRLAFSVDPAYRSDPSCAYMMADTTLAYAILLKDSYGRPLLRDSYKDGIMIPTLNGYPVKPNQFMTGCTGSGGVPVTASKHVIFGAMNRFKIRDVGAVRVRRLDERYAEKDQVGFIAFMRSDSRCVNTNAIKYMLQA